MKTDELRRAVRATHEAGWRRPLRLVPSTRIPDGRDLVESDGTRVAIVGPVPDAELIRCALEHVLEVFGDWAEPPAYLVGELIDALRDGDPSPAVQAWESGQRIDLLVALMTPPPSDPDRLQALWNSEPLFHAALSLLADVLPVLVERMAAAAEDRQSEVAEATERMRSGMERADEGSDT